MYLKYVVARFAVFLVVIVISISINFMVPRLMPGDPVEARLTMLQAANSGAMADISAMVKAYKEKFGTDQPLWKQYLNYWRSLLHLDLGYSLANYPRRVSDVIRAGLPWTIGLLGTSTLIAFSVGTLLGGLVAWPSAPRLIRGLVPIFMVVSAVPYFLLGIVFVFFFAITIKIFPAGGGAPFAGILRFDLKTAGTILHHAALPALSIVLSGIGSWALGMRGMMISTLGEDFITLAEAKGLKQRRIFLWYGVRNSLLPQLTRLGLALGYVVSGAVLVEVVFSYPGIGYALYEAINARDYFVLQGIVLLLILSIAVVTFVLDMIYPLIDPRITFKRR